jgi:hypothetical protein
MKIFRPATLAAAILLSGAPAFADPLMGAEGTKGFESANGLVPEQAGPAPAGPVHVVRGAHNASGGSLPEPASWGLMIVGFGGMGAVLRSRRRRPPATAA